MKDETNKYNASFMNTGAHKKEKVLLAKYERRRIRNKRISLIGFKI